MYIYPTSNNALKIVNLQIVICYNWPIHVQKVNVFAARHIILGDYAI